MPRQPSVKQNAVNNAVLAGAGGDADTALVGLDDSALHEDVTTNVVGVRSILDNTVDGAEGRLARGGVVDADLVGGHDTNHGVTTGFSVDLALGGAHESELLLGGNFRGALAAGLNLATTGWFAS